MARDFLSASKLVGGGGITGKEKGASFKSLQSIWGDRRHGGWQLRKTDEAVAGWMGMQR